MSSSSLVQMKTESKTKGHHMEEKTQSVTLTVDEARAQIGDDKISRGAFYGAIRRGEVPHVKLGRRIFIPRNAWERWLESAGR